MFYDHRSICVWYTWEEISDCRICLLIDLFLGFWNRFDFIEAISTGLRNYYCFPHNFSSFVDDDFAEMVSSSMYMFGYL